MYTEDKLLFILIASALILVGVIGYFLVSMSRAHRKYLLLHDMQSQAKIVALEKERQLIAADLHDDIGPILSATMFKLGEINPADTREQMLLKESINHVDEMVSRLRHISSLLVPQYLAKNGPLYAIEEFISVFHRNHSLEVNVNAIQCEGLSPERSLHLFRMLQEIVHNTIKHAKAKQLSISGSIVKNKLIVHTADDGIGFYVGFPGDHPGLGLQNLSLRARMIEAKLIVDSFPGSGTKYTIELTLPEK